MTSSLCERRVRSDVTKHPMQPIVIADDGVVRFQPNAIVAFIVDLLVGSDAPGALVAGDSTRLTYNDLMGMPWSDADRDHFHQLHGYSVSGLPWRSQKRQAEADRIADAVRAGRPAPTPLPGPPGDRR